MVLCLTLMLDYNVEPVQLCLLEMKTSITLCSRKCLAGAKAQENEVLHLMFTWTLPQGKETDICDLFSHSLVLIKAVGQES